MELPFEIWLCIADFLPEDCLQGLYSVNRAFFAIAMKVRYGDIMFLGQESMLRNIKKLHDSPQTRHVTKLTVCSNGMANLFRPYTIRKGGLFRRWARALFSRRDHSREECRLKTIQAAESMARIVSCMRNVEALVLQSYYSSPGELKLFFPIVRAGWTAFGAGLRHLTLDMSAECYHAISPDCTWGLDPFRQPCPQHTDPAVLEPTMIFPRLESLDIRFSSASSGVIRTVLAPFVNNHRATLESFALSYDYCGPTDTTDFLLLLARMPRLRTLRIRHWFTNLWMLDTRGLEHILAMHADQIREFDLEFRSLDWSVLTQISADVWFAQGFLNIALPGLDSLRLNVQYFDVDLGMTLEYLNQFSSSLCSLAMERKAFSFAELSKVTDALAEFDQLQKLECTVDALTPALLDLLAAKLPNLRTLTLSSRVLKPDVGDEANDFTWNLLPELFCFSMRQRNYSKWKLRHFKVDVLDYGWQSDIAMCDKAFRKAMPGLDTMNLTTWLD